MWVFNTSQSPNVYLDLGGAISALGFTLAIQQFLKPIYLFRLAAYRFKTEYLYILIGCGFIFSIIAAVLHNIEISDRSFFEYPITWELLGTFFIGTALGLIAILSVIPVRVTNFTLLSTARVAGRLLSEADDTDRVSFAEDIARNLPALIKYASAWERAQMHADYIRMDELQAHGITSAMGLADISAFYRFAHRTELERASHASFLLRLIADPNFCSALVSKCPWRTASMMRELAAKNLHSDQAKSFVQEIARQAVMKEESMLAREMAYDGFGSAPLLSESLFGNWYILHHYEPFQKLWLGGGPIDLSVGYLARLNGVTEMALKTTVKSKEYWSHYMYGAQQAYERLFLQLSVIKYEGLSSGFLVELHSGLSKLHQILSENIESVEERIYRGLFKRNAEEHRFDIVDIITSIIFKSFTSFANFFKGQISDNNWMHAIDTFSHIYPRFQDAPNGLNPLQQQLAIKLIDKLKDNMNGWYPAISRILLAVIGPYETVPEIPNRTAYAIIRDAVYKELQKLPELYATKPDKISDYLPASVTYNPTNNSLTHTFTGGDTRITNLSTLIIPEVNLYDESNWRIAR